MKVINFNFSILRYDSELCFMDVLFRIHPERL